MAEVKLVSVKKIYPTTGSEKKKAEDVKEEEVKFAEERANPQITDEGVIAVQEFSMDIADKEFIVLVGPSGCGKSTTLRMIAGLEDITEGEIYIGGRLINNIAPRDRDIAMVFQNYALYPHMTAYENMAFSLKMKKIDKETIDKKVREAAEILDITPYLKRKPKSLSGGQRQRVAIGRAIVREPKVFLMDEPLSNLDTKLRNQMRAEIIKLRQRINTTFVYVTHDQTEAMTLGDRIVIMKDGFIQQIGTPQEVYNSPSNLFVASFIGSPQMNLIDTELIIEDGKYYVCLQDKKFLLSDEKQKILKEKNVPAGIVVCGIRPENIMLCEKTDENALAAKVEVSEMMGSSVHLHAEQDDKAVVMVIPTVEADAEAKRQFKYGEEICIKFDLGRLHLFSKETKLSFG
ncbi:MAG: sn-glycerol-3-phosphate ABC transporter ATP-binding protein UgpC [Ruminococcaceae bacterium]|nr:sn-glycerol-3-phosphate ABC transporter ATP-binding protein UgpC [Oscillospiraceae bacterium]